MSILSIYTINIIEKSDTKTNTSHNNNLESSAVKSDPSYDKWFLSMSMKVH